MRTVGSSQPGQGAFHYPKPPSTKAVSPELSHQTRTLSVRKKEIGEGGSYGPRKLKGFTDVPSLLSRCPSDLPRILFWRVFPSSYSAFLRKPPLQVLEKSLPFLTLGSRGAVCSPCLPYLHSPQSLRLGARNPSGWKGTRDPRACEATDTVRNFPKR